MLANRDIMERMKHFQVIGLSMAIIQNGKLSQVEGFGLCEADGSKSINRETMFSVCSISKFVTALVVLKLVEQGIVDLDEDVNDKLISWKVPNCNLTSIHKVTLRNLLSHQSGIEDPAHSFGVFDSSQGIPTMLEILEGRTLYCSEAARISHVPGTAFHYSDMGYCVVQQLIEDVTGKAFTQLVRELIFEPLAMKNSRYASETLAGHDVNFACGHHKNGNVIDNKYCIYPYPSAAGLWSTASELAQLAIEVLNTLQDRGKLGISQNTINEMITAQGCVPWAGLSVFFDQSGRELEMFSLGWGVGYQCMLKLQPHLGTGAVMMTNSDLGVHQNEGLIGELMRSIAMVE
ncbi:serine hydrolase domain-containing protein [Paenibacillus agilis]|uniref:Beta-lactamase family protein n=1 Tax=Paenibacillus agilis TaxID=3020863 RepID=A0A559IYF0_9BACL|nr:serine hydrolase domain-containing protein [Paenibacillus agilis]TVX92656.1 beta-lactamase family protein [Paenibacillus agilis]